MVVGMLLAVHVMFMLTALGLVLVALGGALWYLQRGTHFPLVVAAAFSTAATLFVGGLPLGWAVAYQEFGVAWTGVPIGWDFTDNKTLVMLLYWLGALALVRGRITACVLVSLHESLRFVRLRALARRVRVPRRVRPTEAAIVSNRTFARLALYGSFASLATFVVPHSIKLPAWVSLTAFALFAAPFLFVGPRTGRRVWWRARSWA